MPPLGYTPVRPHILTCQGPGVPGTNPEGVNADLVEHIQQLGGESQSDSVFILDLQHTVERLIGPSPGQHWTTRLVQAAVACGAREVQFVFHRVSIDVFVLGGSVPPADQLFCQATSNERPQETAVRHLIAALRGLFQLPTKSIQWESGGEMVEVAANRLTHKPLRVIDSTPSLSVRVKFQLRRLLYMRQIASDYKEVCDRARLCPIPILVDSRLISHCEPPVPVSKNISAVWVGEERDGERHFPLYLGDATGSPSKDGIYIGEEDSWITRRSSPEAGLYSCPLVVCLTKSRQRSGVGTVHWLVDGVLVEQTSLPCPVDKWEVDLVLPATLDNLEATGCGPKDPDRLIPRELVIETLRAVHDTLKPYPKALESALLTPAGDTTWAKMDKVLFSCMFTLAAEGWRASTEAHWSGEELLDSLRRMSEGLAAS